MARVNNSLRNLLRVLQLRQSYTCSSHTHKTSESIHIPRSTHLVALTHRSLIKVKGEEGAKLLQGLVTADMDSFDSPSQALYSMMLNVQGRVLYDIIMYKREDGEYLLECDSRATQDIIKHLRKYALRSKVQVSDLNNERQLWALFPGRPDNTLNNTDDVECFSDPRLSTFGTRVISSSGTTVQPSQWTDVEEATAEAYHRHRLEVGIAEGVTEIPMGNCFPLEYNLDYLNGVSFSKGCYLGQELTARTHHTGVVRKRIMPVVLHKEKNCDMPSGTAIITNAGKSAGKLVCHHGEVGLALLRIQELSKGDLILKTPDEKRVGVTTHKPSWWPA